MQATDELLAIAEISVALIGFSGLVSVFRARTATDLEARDLSALAVIVGAGSLSLVFSLIPLPLPYLGLSETLAWTISAVAFSLALLGAAVVFASVNHRLGASGHPERSPKLNRATQASLLVAAGCLGLSGAGVFPRGPGVYLVVLTVCLMLCLGYVAVLLVVRRSG